MKSDPEHEQDHAEFRELLRQRNVGDEAGGVRADQNPRNHVPDDRRDLQTIGDSAKNERQHESRYERGDERRIMRHGEPFQSGILTKNSCLAGAIA